MIDNTTTFDPLVNLDLSDQPLSQKTLKLLIFQVGKLYTALSVDFVTKILKGAEIDGSGTTEMGITQVNNQDITVIDLHQRLFKQRQTLDKNGKPFLILAKNTIDEVFGILVSETPTLLDVPMSEIRILPDSYRRGDTLEIATHVTRVEQNNQLLTVFVLDVDKLVPPISLGDFVF